MAVFVLHASSVTSGSAIVKSLPISPKLCIRVAIGAALLCRKRRGGTPMRATRIKQGSSVVKMLVRVTVNKYSSKEPI